MVSAELQGSRIDKHIPHAKKKAIENALPNLVLDVVERQGVW